MPASSRRALFQIDRPQTTVDTGNRFIVGGKSRYCGLELSASGDITPQFGVVTSLQLLDARSGRRVPATPASWARRPRTRRAARLACSANTACRRCGPGTNAGVFHVGKRAVNNLNQAWVGSYKTLSLGARHRTRLAGDVTMQADLDNAIDRDYWATAGSGLLGTGAPRTLRLAAKVDFEPAP